jgi:hypothetical protein
VRFVVRCSICRVCFRPSLRHSCQWRKRYLDSDPLPVVLLVPPQTALGFSPSGHEAPPYVGDRFGSRVEQAGSGTGRRLGTNGGTRNLFGSASNAPEESPRGIEPDRSVEVGHNPLSEATPCFEAILERLIAQRRQVIGSALVEEQSQVDSLDLLQPVRHLAASLTTRQAVSSRGCRRVFCDPR